MAGLISMAPYQWTNTAGLSMEGLKVAGQMAAARDKQIKQTTTQKTKTSGGSGLGGVIGSALGGIAGSVVPGVGTMLGASIGGALGGAIDGGSSGAAQGAGMGLGMGTSLAGSDSFNSAMGSLWSNLGLGKSKEGYDFSGKGGANALSDPLALSFMNRKF